MARWNRQNTPTLGPPLDLPDGVAEMFALTKYQIRDFGTPFRDGLFICTADGAAHSPVIPRNTTYEQWKSILATLLDGDIEWQEIFREDDGWRKI